MTRDGQFAAFLVNTIKFIVLVGVVYLAITVATTAISASAPSANDLCNRVRPGMTTEQIEDATAMFQEWYMLRDDGTLVISARPHYSSSPVCRIGIDPTTHRATTKSIGPLQSGDWPTL